jgi:BirA family biotin operon repressor/biotin-[acetyl-CoA-carboxylase] ligase
MIGGEPMAAQMFGVLRLLADGNFHSRASLARELGAAPGAIQLALRALESLGLEVRRVRGRGCRLAEPYEFLNAAALSARLGPQAGCFQPELRDSCDSSNTLLLERARRGAPSGSVIACELQSAGRGRRGNAWQSGLGGNLTFSLLWRFPRSAAGLAGLTLAAGVAVARALASLDIEGVQLKWPNDLLHAGRKLGGILIEAQGEAAGTSAAVIGIGVNVRLPAALREAIAQAVTDLASISLRVPSRNRLLAAILIELEQVLTQFAAHGFAPLRDEWMTRNAHQGRLVTLSSGDGSSVSGKVMGVAEDGALLLQTERGLERHVNGELSLRAG